MSRVEGKLKEFGAELNKLTEKYQMQMIASYGRLAKKEGECFTSVMNRSNDYDTMALLKSTLDIAIAQTTLETFTQETQCIGKEQM